MRALLNEIIVSGFLYFRCSVYSNTFVSRIIAENNHLIIKQERLQEIPTASTTISDGHLHGGVEEPFAAALPGSELEYMRPNMQVAGLHPFLFCCLLVSSIG